MECPYHDTPLSAGGDQETGPFWSSADNVEASEYLRLACVEYQVTDNNAGTVTTAVVSHECQRYMSATAYGWVVCRALKRARSKGEDLGAACCHVEATDVK